MLQIFPVIILSQTCFQQCQSLAQENNWDSFRWSGPPSIPPPPSTPPPYVIDSSHPILSTYYEEPDTVSLTSNFIIDGNLDINDSPSDCCRPNPAIIVEMDVPSYPTHIELYNRNSAPELLFNTQVEYSVGVITSDNHIEVSSDGVIWTEILRIHGTSTDSLGLLVKHFME